MSEQEISVSVVNHGGSTFYLFQGDSPQEAIVAKTNAIEMIEP